MRFNESYSAESLRTNQNNLLSEISQMHRLFQLSQGNRVCNKVLSKGEVGIIGAVSPNNIRARQINRKMLLKVYLRLFGDRTSFPIGSILCKYCKPVKNTVLPGIEIDLNQPFRIKIILIGITIVSGPAGPLLCQLNMLGAIKPLSVVISDGSQSIFRELYYMI